MPRFFCTSEPPPDLARGKRPSFKMEAGAAEGEGVTLRLRPCSSCSVEVVEGREGKERGASSMEERGEEEPSTRLSSLDPGSNKHEGGII